jgi:hypothetical protein
MYFKPYIFIGLFCYGFLLQPNSFFYFILELNFPVFQLYTGDSGLLGLSSIWVVLIFALSSSIRAGL